MDTSTSKIKGYLAAAAAAVLGFLGWIFFHALPETIGHKFGEHVGPRLIIPALVIAGCWWVASKALKPELKPIVPVVGVVGGQFLFFLLVVFLSGMEGAAALSVDIVVIGAGFIWLFNRPGVAPLTLLMIYEILTLVINFLNLFSLDLNESGVLAMVAGMAIRVFAIVVLLISLFELRSNRQKATGQSPVS